MKTIRILLYPDEEQTEIMRKLVDDYCICLQNQMSCATFQAEYPSSLCESSIIQLGRDIRRRLGKGMKGKIKLPRMYCRWGSDYSLQENKVVLPLGNGFDRTGLTIACTYRPFQRILLLDRHPATLTLKRMKSHWFAYVLVDEIGRR